MIIMRYYFAMLISLLFVWCTSSEAAQRYAVVVKKNTLADAEWKPVVEALQKKYEGARVIEYADAVTESLPELKKYFPRYTCFVAKPEEASRVFVTTVHRLTRLLDRDPYADTVWGILTGYEAADALRIARLAEPLTVKRVLTGTVGAPLDAYEEGRMFNELKANTMWEKLSGKEVTAKECPQDTIKLIVDSLNEYAPDVFITSGHATESDWQPGYGYKNGSFRCENGQLYGLDKNGSRFDVKSPNPKVHLPVGNCLIGHIKQRDCMALALIHSAGVNQLVGYTITTGYGYGGWGVKDYFSELQAGRFTLAEAHHANQIALIYNLEKNGLNREGESRGGMRGDRDTVVLYGDPAWDARMPVRELPWSQSMTEDNGNYTFTIKANVRGDWDNRPVVHFLGHRIQDVKITKGSELNPVIMDDFILVDFNKDVQPMKGNQGETIPVNGDYNHGDTFVITFSASQVD